MNTYKIIPLVPNGHGNTYAVEAKIGNFTLWREFQSKSEATKAAPDVMSEAFNMSQAL